MTVVNQEMTTWRICGRTRRLVKCAASVILLVGASLAFVVSEDAKAHPADTPTANKVVSGCTFSAAALRSILNIAHDSAFADIAGVPGGDPDIQVSYLVVYVKDTGNHGQELSGGGSTGPVLCRNTDADGIGPFLEVTESTEIPTDTHDNATDIDILDTNAANVLKFEVNTGAGVEPIENRFCHTAGGVVSCFLAQPQ